MAMKRIVVMLMSLGMLVGALGTAEAKQSPRSERTVQGSYGPYPAPVTGCNEPLGPWSCLTVQTRSTEAFFTAAVADTHGQPVAVDVYTRHGDRPFQLLASFCGKTTRPIAVTPGWTLTFEVGLSSGPTLPCPANRVKTTGTIRVTLSNQR